MAIYSEFSHKKWRFSIVMLVYQRVRLDEDIFRMWFRSAPGIPTWDSDLAQGLQIKDVLELNTFDGLLGLAFPRDSQDPSLSQKNRIETACFPWSKKDVLLDIQRMIMLILIRS